MEANVKKMSLMQLNALRKEKLPQKKLDEVNKEIEEKIAIIAKLSPYKKGFGN